jgi:ABC-2 type transport system permease protein
MIPIWVAVFALVAASSAGATVGLYPKVEDRIAAANTFNTTEALVALYGKVYDPTSLGAISMIKLGGLGAIFIAILAIILVGRHTRAEEESGRLELVGATVVGRRAPLTAALMVTMGTMVVLAVLTALGLSASGLPADGSFAFGAAWGGVGIAFAAVAAFSAQLTTTARSATSLSLAFLGLVYLLRAVGDTAGSGGPRWLVWLSPIGWGQQFRPYAGDRWWVLLITLGFAAVVTAGAYALAARRDLGAGLLADRLGPAQAAASLRSPLALAWRLHRGLLLAWCSASLVGGMVMGNIATSLQGFMDSPRAQELFETLGGQKGLTNAYLAAIFGIVGIIAAAYGIQAASRLRGEEAAQRAEPLLATGTSRAAFLGSHTLLALLGSSAVLVVAGLATGVAYAARVSDAGPIGNLLVAALAHAPAAWVLTGTAVAAYGLVPRFAAAGWTALVVFVLLGEVGPVLNLKQWLMNISPFAHSPKLPGNGLSAMPLVVLAAVAAALLAAGFIGFRRRDIPTT